MRINPVSDLHFAHDSDDQPYRHPHVVADLIVLAGDIEALGRPETLLSFLASADTLLIHGNHDPYGWSLGTAADHAAATCVEANALAAQSGLPGRITILPDCGVLEHSGVRVVCATLWTDLDRGNPLAEMNAQRLIRDFQNIEGFTPAQWLHEHRRHRAFLEETLAQDFNGRTVVVTHHAPTYASVNPRFISHPLNPAYASALDHLLASGAADLWIHGHMHHSVDDAVSGTRIVCNPRGHRGENPDFRPDLIVEV